MSRTGVKVNTYGKKTKTQIISIHSDHDQQSSPAVRPLAARPVLQSKLSQDNYNIYSATPLAVRTLKGEASAKDHGTPTKLNQHLGKRDENTPIKVRVAGKANSPILGQRKVTRKGLKPSILRTPPFASKVVKTIPSLEPPASPTVDRPVESVLTPKPATTALPTKPTVRRRLVFDGVAIPVAPGHRLANMDRLSARMAQITITEDPSPRPDKSKGKAEATTDPVQKLVEGCSIKAVHDFTTLLRNFPLLSSSAKAVVTKVGEASYSEVFGFSSPVDTESDPLVIKIIPLLSEPGDVGGDTPMPDCSDPEDVLREIEVTKHMSNVPGGGYVQFKGAYVVEGEYPRQLLKQWDTYKSTEGSASVRPSAFPSSQKYALIALSHSGQDLEAFRFDASRGWVQAAGIFWQTAKALAEAEQWADFEHRDLHEGQILISTDPSLEPTETLNYLSPTYTCLTTTIIDFGLSRLALPPHKTPTWSSLPEELYEGKGKQWDVYRSMKDRIDGDWEGFHAITNVLWLQYILQYILTSKSLRKPRVAPAASTKARRPRAPTPEKAANEQAYEMLQQVSKVLAWSLEGAKRQGRRGAGETEEYGVDKMGDAAGIVAWGEKKGWIV
ncbi:hypothetical protein B9479_002846 [Cryptococcus floricola]|uniref:non-specific serine/threonine protein kinase n=1 Tax=Cryptococcus floricola TaxID=2591691 RepID=A0A5D3B2L0_9TREE|nr:hypothetical protein B9479_002846 [Cryptococcus floricola]